MTTTHELKSWPEFYAPLAKGVKNFELRKNDRHFNVGDILLLREFDDLKGVYTGQSVRKRVTYILEGYGTGSIEPMIGLHRGYAILGIEDASHVYPGE